MASINTHDLEWKKIYEGVFTRHLAKDASSGIQLDMFKLEPGVILQPHIHPQYEWVYVLEGVYEDEYGACPAGHFKINEKGSQHTSQSQAGCTLLVYWCGKHNPVR